MREDSFEVALERMVSRLDATIAAEPTGFPHYADPSTGEWTLSPDGDWTGGFFTGQLWLAATVVGHDRFRGVARDWTRRMLTRANSDTIFRGFLFWYGAALGAVLDNDSVAREVALEGATGLASSYNSVAQLLPLGTTAEESSDVGTSETNIDGVPGGVPLLVWAAAIADRSELTDIALAHAHRHVELCVREDGSVCQSASFDPLSGKMLRRYTHKGFNDNSTWTRAQAWALLGFAQAAVIDPAAFSEVMRRVADWFIEHLPEQNVTNWDFDDPDIANAPIDTSGTAIAAAALLKADRILGGNAPYRHAAEQMVAALVRGHLTRDGILADGCYNNRIGLATSAELIWGDYFLFESLCVLTEGLDPVVV